MKLHSVNSCVWAILSLLIVVGCNQSQSAKKTDPPVTTVNYGGFKSQVEWGRHLVLIGGCNDCHTPKKMTAMGPVPDASMMLAGHPSNVPPPVVNRREMEKQGLAVTNDLTVWIGPWGISYAANLTPDETGIGNWTQAQFFKAIREGKYKGLDGTRPLLPPMSFIAEGVRVMSDDELAAVFAYLKSVKPVHNLVPQPAAPEMAMKH
ncbi:MAG TPA: hypothetical protein VKA08_01620 [Balneolales bacterium]|nr:hypothetical protein [Balneolales bacterium]